MEFLPIGGFRIEETFQNEFAPLKTNECPLKNDYFNRKYIFHWFSGDMLVFREVCFWNGKLDFTVYALKFQNLPRCPTLFFLLLIFYQTGSNKFVHPWSVVEDLTRHQMGQLVLAGMDYNDIQSQKILGEAKTDTPLTMNRCSPTKGPFQYAK